MSINSIYGLYTFQFTLHVDSFTSIKQRCTELTISLTFNISLKLIYQSLTFHMLKVLNTENQRQNCRNTKQYNPRLYLVRTTAMEGRLRCWVVLTKTITVFKLSFGFIPLSTFNKMKTQVNVSIGSVKPSAFRMFVLM